jgi:hypothetical protein
MQGGGACAALALVLFDAQRDEGVDLVARCRVGTFAPPFSSLARRCRMETLAPPLFPQ